MESSLV